MVIQIFCFDIDETICTTRGMSYEKAVPILERILKINSLFDEGNIIKFYTARGSKTGIDWEPLTREQLQNWGVRYHELHMGKPFADLYIDDKAISDSDFGWI